MAAPFHLILLVLAFVLACLATGGIGHPRFHTLSAAFAAFVLAALVP